MNNGKKMRKWMILSGIFMIFAGLIILHLFPDESSDMGLLLTLVLTVGGVSIIVIDHFWVK